MDTKDKNVVINNNEVDDTKSQTEVTIQKTAEHEQEYEKKEGKLETQLVKKKIEKQDEPITLKQALDNIDKFKVEISKGVKVSPVKYLLDIYFKIQKQKATPDDLTELLNKISITFPEFEMKVLLNIFIDMRSKDITNPYILAYILNECIERLNNIGYQAPEDPTLEDIIHITSDISESFSYFLRDVNEKNKSVIQGRFKDSDIIIVNYMYLSILIKYFQKSPSHGVNLFIMMERAFVECYLTNPEKSAEKFVGLYIPKMLLSKNPFNQIGTAYYLYSEYRRNCFDLKKKLDEQKSENNGLRETLKEYKENVEQLKTEIDVLKEQISNQKIKIEEIENERQKAEDRLKFENNRFEMQSKSMKDGIVRNYKSVLGLEIEGIEDILEYIPEQAQEAIQERLDRMRNIMNEEENK